MTTAPNPAETAPNLTGFGKGSTYPRRADLFASTGFIFTFTN
jgi:hypothetical protein